MRALWVSAIPPSPDGGGGHIRQAHLLEALSTRFDVDLVVAGPGTAASVRASVASFTELPVALEPPPAARLRRRWHDVRDVLVLRRHTEIAAYAEVRRALARAVGERAPADLVQVEYLGLAPLVRLRRGEHWAITLHNLGSGMARQRAAVAEGARQRALHRHNAANAARAERRAASEFDTTIVCSDDDAAAIAGDALVVPNGVDLDRFCPSPVPEAPEVLFLGALNTDPNADGVRWFVESIWPSVRAARPDARLAVVGMAPVPEVVACCRRAGVALHADVDSTAPFLAASRVVVVPLRIGTGSRLKALEAWASGRPVVGTTVGLGGLAYEPGREVLVADDAAGFASAVVQLLEPGPHASAVAAAGRATVETRYGWARIGEKYADALAERAAATRRAAISAERPLR